MANTTNLNLVKPAGTDKALVSVLNSNSDKIDAWACTTNQALAKYGNAAGTRITSGSDLNSVTTAGNYYVDTATDASNISNMPANIGGRLEVTEINGSSRLRQIFFTNSNRPDVYVRSYISTGWTVWEKLAYASDTDNTAKSAFTSWGTSITAENFHQGLLLISYNGAYIVWFSGTDGIAIRSLRTSDGSKTGQGSISFSADDISGTSYTITRSGLNFSLQSTSSTAFTLLYR